MRQSTGGRRPRGRPNRKQHLPLRNQTFDSNGPEVRVRGNAHQVYEKYLALARDATSSGDRIAAEGFYQFAEHYYRIVNSSTDPERAQPDGQGGRRERQGAPNEGGERSGEAGGPPQQAAEQPGTEQPRAAPVEGNGADHGDSPTPEAGEQEKPAARSGSSRRRSSRRGKRETANGSHAASEAPEGEESSEGDDAEPVSA